MSDFGEPRTKKEELVLLHNSITLTNRTQPHLPVNSVLGNVHDASEALVSFITPLTPNTIALLLMVWAKSQLFRFQQTT